MVQSLRCKRSSDGGHSEANLTVAVAPSDIISEMAVDATAANQTQTLLATING